ncbi:MAG TPA: methyltransferase [Flavisolibacter sp.]|nr:methyltransferase [Flavisolibacter sp.]
MSTGQISRAEQKKLTFSLDPVKYIWEYVKTIIAISGYRLEHATILRTVVMVIAVGLTFTLPLVTDSNPEISLIYFALSTSAYIGFIYLVLPENGYRHWFMQKFGGEQEGFLAYEALLAFLFFISGSSIGIVAASYPGDFDLNNRVVDVIKTIAVLSVVIGFFIKTWAAKVVSVDIYYWKDMFLGRKISDFVVKGPYKFVKNPMYGLGLLQSYGVAIWYMSYQGLIVAVIYQLLIFSFYFIQEKQFIKRVYLKENH